MIRKYDKNKKECVDHFKSKKAADSNLLKRRLRKQISIKTWKLTLKDPIKKISNLDYFLYILRSKKK